MSFPCTSCGACCIVIPKQFEGWPLREDGACLCLTEDRQCRIYATRPRLCHIDELKLPMSQEEYYAQTAAMCNTLQEQLGIDARYRVKL
jgi:Fe-S-cluster containining protein